MMVLGNIGTNYAYKTPQIQRHTSHTKVILKFKYINILIMRDTRLTLANETSTTRGVHNFLKSDF